MFNKKNHSLLAHLAYRPCELLPSLSVRRMLTFHILIFCKSAQPNWTKPSRDGPWEEEIQLLEYN